MKTRTVAVVLSLFAILLVPVLSSRSGADDCQAGCYTAGCKRAFGQIQGVEYEDTIAMLAVGQAPWPGDPAGEIVTGYRYADYLEACGPKFTPIGQFPGLGGCTSNQNYLPTTEAVECVAED